MSTSALSKTQPLPVDGAHAADWNDVPLTVRQAATYLGVSVQTVYLWVERKQIPHLRVMAETSGSSNRISSPSARSLYRRW
jgi:excisionase family DNA binding protein